MSETESTPAVGAPLDGYDDMTVGEIVEHLRRSTPQHVGEIKAYEAARDKPRKGILDFEPSPDPLDDGQERHDVSGWKERARARFGVSPHAVAGALHDCSGVLLTEAEARGRIRRWTEG